MRRKGRREEEGEMSEGAHMALRPLTEYLLRCLSNVEDLISGWTSSAERVTSSCNEAGGKHDYRKHRLSERSIAGATRPDRRRDRRELRNRTRDRQTSARRGGGRC